MQTKKLNNGKNNFTVNYVRGNVAGKDKNLETVFSASGGGHSYQGTGSSYLSVNSETKIHDKIFIEEENGKQFAIELTDWDIACLPGHEMLAIWIKKEGNKNSEYVAIKNFTTDDKRISETAIDNLVRFDINEKFGLSKDSAGVAMLLFFGLVAFVFYGLYIIGGILLTIIGILALVFLAIARKKSVNAERAIINGEIRKILAEN